MPMKLSTAGLTKARDFLRTQARPLEWAIFRQQFEAGTAAPVVAELAKFQNADGGFGRALEVDLRTADSSALCTTHALQIVQQLPGVAGRPLVRRAMEYLARTYDPDAGVWRIIPPTATTAPHAPWWNQPPGFAANWNGFQANPRAEIAGYLFAYPGAGPDELRQRVLRDVLAYLAGPGQGAEMHELRCYVRLAELEQVPAAARRQVVNRLQPIVTRVVERDPAKWSGYTLKPLWIARSPRSPFYPFLRDAVAANLDYEIEHQAADGSWLPNWDWGAAHPDVWPIARREWQGMLTVETLTWLRAFGRWP